MSGGSGRWYIWWDSGNRGSRVEAKVVDGKWSADTGRLADMSDSEIGKCGMAALKAIVGH
jgi:hypothetical protein